MVYHRPGTSSEHFFDDLNALLEKINSNCIILGDLNINLISYNNKSINLVNFFREFSFIPCITKPTRVTNNSVSLIDHIWTNIIEDAVIESKIIFSDVSDHFPVVLNLPMTSGCNTYKTISYRRSGEIYDNDFKNHLENCNFDNLMEMNNVDEAFERFSEIVYNIYDESYPQVVKNIRVIDSKKPWLTSGLKQSIKNKNRLYKKFLKRPITYGEEYRRYRNIVTRTIKASKNKYYRDKFDQYKGDSKKTWKQLNKVLGKSKIPNPMCLR